MLNLDMFNVSTCTLECWISFTKTLKIMYHNLALRNTMLDPSYLSIVLVIIVLRLSDILFKPFCKINTKVQLKDVYVNHAQNGRLRKQGNWTHLFVIPSDTIVYNIGFFIDISHTINVLMTLFKVRCH